MCLETMDTRSKHIKIDYLRKTTKLGSTLGLRVIRVSKEDGAFKKYRASAEKVTVRKYLRREQRRTQLDNLSKVLGGKNEMKESMYKESPAVAHNQRQPPGAMAPENTTQYLMSNVYEDMKTNNVQTLAVSHGAFSQLYGECLSPSAVYTALDCGYESCLAFQQRDFEKEFDSRW